MPGPVLLSRAAEFVQSVPLCTYLIKQGFALSLQQLSFQSLDLVTLV